MSSKKKSAKPKSRAKAKNGKAAASAAPKVDTGVRSLPSKAVITGLYADHKACLNRSGEASQAFGNKMRDAQERGVNPVAFGAASRFMRKAENDPAKALVNKEDFDFYLECLGFDKLTTKPMFKASETRSGKKNNKKDNPAQADLVGNGGDPNVPVKEVGDAELQEAAGAVH